MSWFAKGNDANRSALMSATTQKKVQSFWLKVGESRELIFVDDPQFLINEVSLKKTNTDQIEQYTCSGVDCPMIAAGYTPYPIEVYTVIDLTPWKDDKGVEHKFTRRLFKAKGKKTIELLKDRRQTAGGSLVGVKMKVKRMTEKSTNCGDDFQVLGKVDLSKVPDEAKKIFEYENILAPLDSKRLEGILKYSYPPGNSKNKQYSKNAASMDDVFGATQSFPTDSPAAVSYDNDQEIPF